MRKLKLRKVKKRTQAAVLLSTEQGFKSYLYFSPRNFSCFPLKILFIKNVPLHPLNLTAP